MPSTTTRISNAIMRFIEKVKEVFSLQSIVVKWDYNEKCVLSGSHISGKF